MTMKFFSAGIVMAALLALSACKSETTGSGGGGGTGGTGGTGGVGGTGGTGGQGGTGGTAPSCNQCACVDLISAGGCADKCKMGTNGTTTPNFCDGVAALQQCS